MNVACTVSGIRKKINNRFKKLNIQYEYSLALSRIYDGEGFYINSRFKVNELNRIYGCDKHWAYGGALVQYKFPLSSRMTKKETELGIYLLEFTHIQKRHKDFYYTLYLKHIHREKKNGKTKYIIALTNLDFQIFIDLYKTDFKIISKKYFKDIGFLGISDIVEEYYKKKKKDIAENKYKYEAGFYGMFASLLLKAVKKKGKGTFYSKKRNKLKLAQAIVDSALNTDRKQDIEQKKDLRNSQVVIAMFQTAYLRFEEWKMFKKYKKSVVYMNTDSVYCTEPLKEDFKNELGHYDREYDGEYIYFIRRNAYVVLNEDGTIKKSVIGGVINGGDITPEKIEILRTGQSIEAYTLNKEREIVLAELSPHFILNEYKNDYIV